MKKKKRKSVPNRRGRTTSKKKNIKNKRKLWKKVLTVFIALGACGIFIVFGFLLYIVATTGQFDPMLLLIKIKL